MTVRAFLLCEGRGDDEIFARVSGNWAWTLRDHCKRGSGGRGNAVERPAWRRKGAIAARCWTADPFRQGRNLRSLRSLPSSGQAGRQFI